MRTLLFLSLLLFSLCTHADPRKILIFIPGYYGSFLKNQTNGDREFLTLGQVLLTADPLIYPVEGVFPDAKRVSDDGYFDSFNVIPSIFAIDGYRDSVEAFRLWGRPRQFEIHPLSYDWRADLHTILARIEAQIQEIQPTKNDQVILVGHSFGGLIAAYYMRYGTQDPASAKETFAALEWVDAWILAGAPFRGTAQIFRNSFYGVPSAGFRDILAPVAVSSYPSTFLLTPPPDLLRVIDENGQEHPLDAFDAEAYEKNKWGLFQDKLQLSPGTLEKRREWTRQQTTTAKSFYQKLLAPTQIKRRVPVLVLTGEGHKTNQVGRQIPGRAQFVFLPEQYKEFGLKADASKSDVDGDRVVSVESAEPPPFLKSLGAQWERTPIDHADLLKSVDTRPLWKKFLEAQGF